MDNMELRERLEELRKTIDVANAMVFSGDAFQAGAWTTKSLQLITEILKNLGREDEKRVYDDEQ